MRFVTCLLAFIRELKQTGTCRRVGIGVSQEAPVDFGRIRSWLDCCVRPICPDSIRLAWHRVRLVSVGRQVKRSGGCSSGARLGNKREYIGGGDVPGKYLVPGRSLDGRRERSTGMGAS